jgi:hypothetical protein
MPHRNIHNHVTDFDAAMRFELGLLLKSDEFVSAPILSKLLRYLTEQTLAGNKRLKAYEIAVSGLNRPESFDPTTDSYPRVQVGRLRHALETFYAHHPDKPDPCLHIPSGQYGARLSWREVAYPTIVSRKTNDARSYPVQPSVTPVTLAVPISAMIPQTPLIQTEPVIERLTLSRRSWLAILALALICTIVFATIVVVAILAVRR